jgi:Tfp pilus assembly protein FimT
MELIVVMTLIGMMLFFSLPRLDHNPFLDDTKKNARWLMGKLQILRENAVRDQKQYSLHFDLDSGRLWETNESMSPEDLESAELQSYALPEGMRIIDLEYPARGKINSGQAQILFYKGGYSDKVLIHLQSGENHQSFLIEPFLAEIKIFEKYASFED